MAQRLLNRARYYQRVVQRRLGRHALIARTDSATRLVREADEPVARVVSVVSQADRFDQALPPILTRTAAARLMPERALDTAAPAALPVAPVSAPQRAAEESVPSTPLPQDVPSTSPFQVQPPSATPAPAQDVAFSAASGQAVPPQAAPAPQQAAAFSAAPGQAVPPQAVPAPQTMPDFRNPGVAPAANVPEPYRADAQTVQRSVAFAVPAAPQPAAQPAQALVQPSVAPSAAQSGFQTGTPAGVPPVTPEALRPVVPTTPAHADQHPASSGTALPRSTPIWSMPVDTPPAPQTYPTASQPVPQEARAADAAPAQTPAASQTAAAADAAAAPTGAVRLSELTKMIRGMMRRPSEEQEASAAAQTAAPAQVQSTPPGTPPVDWLPAQIPPSASGQVAPSEAVQSRASDPAALSNAAPEPAVAPEQYVSPAPQQYVQPAPSVPVVPPLVQRAEAQQYVPPAPQQYAPQAAPQQYVPPAPQQYAPQAAPQQYVPPAPEQYAPQAAPEQYAPQAAPQQYVPPVPEQFVPPAAPQQFVPPVPSAPVIPPLAQRAEAQQYAPAAPQQYVPPAPEQYAPQAAPQQFVPPTLNAPVVPPVVTPAEARPVETHATDPVAEQTALNQPAEADGVRLSELTKMIRGMMRSADESAPSPQASQPGADTQSAAPEQVQSAAAADVRRPDPEPELPTVSTMKTASGQEVEVRRPRGQRPQITPRPRPPEANQPVPATRAPEPQSEGQTWDLDPNKDRSPEAWRQRLIKLALFEREQAARKAGLLPPEAPATAEQAGSADQAAQPTAQPQPQVPVQQVRSAPQAQPVQPTQPVAAQPVPVAPLAQPQPAAQPQQTLRQVAPQQQVQTSATVQRQPASEPASDDRSPQAWSARLFRQANNEQTPSGQIPSPGGSPAGPVMPAGAAGYEAPIPAAETNGDSEGGYGPQAGDDGYAESALDSGAESSEDIPASARLAMQDSSPTPLPETTRRFLRPLVGIDPADVRIFQGALANQVAAEFNADAVTVGEDVFLATGNEDASPSSLGVLAHELTHVARQREAHFVPPTAADQADTTPGEEQLAESVEANVLQRARTIEQQQAQLPPGSAPLLESDGQWGDSEAVRSSWAGTPFQPSTPKQPAPQDRSVWGNLPAPWEPLPDWMNTPAQEAGPQEGRSLGLESVFSATPPAALSTSMSGLNGGAQPSVQLAEVGRSVESNTTEPAASGGGEEQGKVPEPDLDALARQVYSLLKQRLAAERRRGEI